MNIELSVSIYLLLVVGVWALAFGMAALYFSSLEQGPRRRRETRQFLKWVVPTLIIITLLFLRSRGVV